MKKLVLAAILATSLAACKKGESYSSETQAADSTAMNQAGKSAAADSAALPQALPQKSAEVVLPENKADSAAQSAALPEIRRSDAPGKIAAPDSALAAAPKAISITIKPEKVVRQTRIIYRNAPKTAVRKEKSAPGKTSAFLEFRVKNLDEAREKIFLANAQSSGKILGDDLYAEERQTVNSVAMAIPAANLSEFLAGLRTSGIGYLQSSSVESLGSSAAMASVRVVLSAPASDSLVGANAGFWDSLSAALGKGGQALGGVLLFLVPFWPLYIAGIAAYFYFKKKKRKLPTP